VIEILFPMSALPSVGRVPSRDLTKEGIWLEVINPDDVPGPWQWEYSSWPVQTRPAYKKPDIILAMRTNYVGLGLTFLDAAGKMLPTGRYSVGDDAAYIFYWKDDSLIRGAATLRMMIIRS
jgi:hypothetical protein